MKKVTVLSKSNEVNPVRWIFGGLVLVTLYFQTNLADPFNSPKLWILMLTAAWLTGHLASFSHLIFSTKQLSKLFYITILFILCLILVTAFSDFKYTAIFGEALRRNGFVTYLSLAILLLASAVFVRDFNIKRLYPLTLFTSIILVIYGFMQTTGNDFVKWNNQYNSIISTVGNPNFAAALMAIIGVILFSSLFVSGFKIYYKVAAAILSLLLLILVYLSDAKQGLLSYIIGVGVFLNIWIYNRNKKLGIAAVIIGLTIFCFGILGMLQKGPLERFLYKPSVSIRGYYWRAGIQMFKDHPLIGIGMDRYGAYFKEYREVNYPLKYGFDITSTNAHNTFIQFFATGGLLLGAAYLLINVFILKCAISAIKKQSGNSKLITASILSAWVAYHAQSLVSIDNIGLAVWGWVLGGSLVGLSIINRDGEPDNKQVFMGKKNEINLLKALTSGAFSIVAIVLISLLFRGELNSLKSNFGFNLNDQRAKNLFLDLNLKAINTPLIDPYYKIISASALYKNGFTVEGESTLLTVYKKDPRNLDALNMLSSINEQVNHIPDAIAFRTKLSNLDPWNAVNYLALGKDYKVQGDLVKSKEMLDKILSFAANSPIAEQAKSELAS